MCGVTWRAVPAEFNTGLCEMKFQGLRYCGISWDVNSSMTWRAVPAKFQTGMCEMKS